jgi:hypothetical protein
MLREHGIQEAVYAALLDGPLSLHQLWIKTRLDKKKILQALRQLEKDRTLDALDPAPRPGHRDGMAAHDNRRWQVRRAA